MKEKWTVGSDLVHQINLLLIVQCTYLAVLCKHRDGDSYIVTGHKWWTSGAPDPRCKIAIFMGKTDTAATTYKQQSMILVPMDAPGVDVIRPLRVYGYDDAPHGHAEVMFKVACCPDCVLRPLMNV